MGVQVSFCSAQTSFGASRAPPPTMWIEGAAHRRTHSPRSQSGVQVFLYFVQTSFGRSGVSLRLGPLAVLTVHRTVIHCRSCRFATPAPTVILAQVRKFKSRHSFALRPPHPSALRAATFPSRGRLNGRSGVSLRLGPLAVFVIIHLLRRMAKPFSRGGTATYNKYNLQATPVHRTVIHCRSCRFATPAPTMLA